MSDMVRCEGLGPLTILELVQRLSDPRPLDTSDRRIDLGNVHCFVVNTLEIRTGFMLPENVLKIVMLWLRT